MAALLMAAVQRRTTWPPNVQFDEAAELAELAQLFGRSTTISKRPDAFTGSTDGRRSSFHAAASAVATPPATADFRRVTWTPATAVAATKGGFIIAADEPASSHVTRTEARRKRRVSDGKRRKKRRPSKEHAASGGAPFVVFEDPVFEEEVPPIKGEKVLASVKEDILDKENILPYADPLGERRLSTDKENQPNGGARRKGLGEGAAVTAGEQRRRKHGNNNNGERRKASRGGEDKENGGGGAEQRRLKSVTKKRSHHKMPSTTAKGRLEAAVREFGVDDKENGVMRGNGANVDAMKMFNSSSTHFEPISVSDDLPIVETVTARTQSIGMTTGTMTSQRKAMNVNNKKLVNPLGGSSLRMMR